jgi:hypothetical protein
MAFCLIAKQYTMLKDKIQEILDKYKLNLSVEEPKTITLSKMANAADGSQIGTSADDFAEGVDVFIVVEGEPTMAPDGDITMEDGRVFTITGGVISAIAEAEEEMSADVAAIVSKLAERVSVLESANTASAEALSAAKAENETLTTKLADITAKFEKLSKTQAAASVKDTTKKVALTTEKQVEKPVAVMTMQERIAHYRAKSN